MSVLVNTDHSLYLNHQLNDLASVDLNHYVGIEHIIQFLEDKLVSLRFSLKKKVYLIFNKITEANSLSQALDAIDLLQIDQHELLVNWVSDNYQTLMEQEDRVSWFLNNFYTEKFIRQELNFLFHSYYSNDSDHSVSSVKNFYLAVNFLSTKDSQLINSVPLFFVSVYVSVDSDFFVTVKKTGKNQFFYNPELLSTPGLKINLPHFSSFEKPESFSYKHALQRLIVDNKLTVVDNYYLHSPDYIIKPYYQITSLNYQFKGLKSLPTIKYRINPYQIILNFQNYGNLVDWANPIQLFKPHYNKSLLFNCLSWVNEGNISHLVSQLLYHQKRGLIISTSYDLLMSYFIKNENPIKQLVFFNYDHSQPHLFFDQFKIFVENLQPIVSSTYQPSDINIPNPVHDLDPGQLVNIQNYKALYGLRSVSAQDLDHSLLLIEKLGRNDKWSEWTKIAFKYCIQENLKLNTLLAKAKIIAELNKTYEQFLDTYSYDYFWQNVHQHRRFLEEYDHHSILKVLFYLSMYIKEKNFPKKVKVFSFKQGRYTQNELVFLYKLFYSSAYYKLFYITTKELDILLNKDLVNQEQLLALSNQKWLSETSEFSFFMNSQSYNQTLNSINDPDKNKANANTIVDNYLLYLKRNIVDWSDKDKKLLVDMFDDIKNGRYHQTINLFIRKYWTVIVQLFPVHFYYYNDQYLLTDIFLSTHYDQRIWMITNWNQLLIELSFTDDCNDLVMIKESEDYFDNNASDKLKSLVNSKDPYKIVVDYHLNTRSSSIANVINKDHLAIDYNISSSLSNQIGIKGYYVKEDLDDKNVNVSILKALLRRILTSTNIYPRTCIVVSNHLAQKKLFSFVINNENLYQIFHKHDIHVKSLDTPINYWYDHIIFAFNDLLPEKGHEGYTIYEQKDFCSYIYNYLMWTKQKVTSYISLNYSQLLKIPNEDNRELLIRLFAPKKHRINLNESDLVSYLYDQVYQWLSDYYFHTNISVNLNADHLNQKLIQMIYNDLVVGVVKIYHSHISFDANEKSTQTLVSQKYPTFDLYSYDWMYKKDTVQSLIIEMIKKSSGISVPSGPHNEQVDVNDQQQANQILV